jgi:hypothetical protein
MTPLIISLGGQADMQAREQNFNKKFPDARNGRGTELDEMGAGDQQQSYSLWWGAKDCREHRQAAGAIAAVRGRLLRSLFICLVTS